MGYRQQSVAEVVPMLGSKSTPFASRCRCMPIRWLRNIRRLRCWGLASGSQGLHTPRTITTTRSRMSFSLSHPVNTALLLYILYLLQRILFPSTSILHTAQASDRVQSWLLMDAPHPCSGAALPDVYAAHAHKVQWSRRREDFARHRRDRV